MSNGRLAVVEVDNKPKKTKPDIRSQIKELQAHFERLWLVNPEQFNPSRNVMEKERIERTWKLICEYIDIHNSRVADLGCGWGVISKRLAKAGSNVDALDIAENALKRLREFENSRSISLIHDAMPMTSLQDKTYNLVVATELIAELPTNDHRLFFSELNRIVKSDGWVLVSTGVDIYSEGVVAQLYELAHSEFEIEHDSWGFHSLYIRIKNLLEYPRKVIKASTDKEYKKRSLEERNRISRAWFKINSMFPFVWIWRIFNIVSNPVLRYFEQSRFMLLFLERISKFFNPERPSHVIFLAKKRPLPVMEPEVPDIQRPRKKEIWE